MDTFTFGMRRNWLFRALGPNPLVRRSRSHSGLVINAIRRRLDSRRFAQWDLAVNRVAEGGDRKKSQ